MQTCCMYSAADPPINVRYRPVPPNNKKKRKNSFLEAAPFFKKKTKTKQPILLDDLIRKMLMWSMFSPQIPRKSSNSLNLVCVHRYSQCVSYFYRGLVALKWRFSWSTRSQIHSNKKTFISVLAATKGRIIDQKFVIKYIQAKNRCAHR